MHDRASTLGSQGPILCGSRTRGSTCGVWCPPSRRRSGHGPASQVSRRRRGSRSVSWRRTQVAPGNGSFLAEKPRISLGHPRLSKSPLNPRALAMTLTGVVKLWETTKSGRRPPPKPRQRELPPELFAPLERPNEHKQKVCLCACSCSYARTTGISSRRKPMMPHRAKGHARIIWFRALPADEVTLLIL
jgi:hypothetical protein